MVKANSPTTIATGLVIIAALLLVLSYLNPALFVSTSTIPYTTTISYTSITPSANSTVAVNLQQELNNSSNLGFVLSQNMFNSTSAAQCSLQSISGCNNNIPSQFICVNTQFASTVAYQYHSIYSSPTVCPQFYELANISCGIVQDYCVVLNSQPPVITSANQTN